MWEGAGLDWSWDVVVAVDGASMLKRSLMPLLEKAAELLVVDWAGAGAEKPPEKSPKSLPKLSFRADGIDGGGGVGLGGGAGFASKKLPPLSTELVTEGCLAWPVGGAKPEKGTDLVGCVCEGEAKDSEPKASPIPPNACAFVCDCVGELSWGDCMPPKALIFEDDACWGGGAAGLEA